MSSQSLKKRPGMADRFLIIKSCVLIDFCLQVARQIGLNCTFFEILGTSLQNYIFNYSIQLLLVGISCMYRTVIIKWKPGLIS